MSSITPEDDITNDENMMYLIGSVITAIHTHHQLALWRETYMFTLSQGSSSYDASIAAAQAVAAMSEFADAVEDDEAEAETD